MNPSGTAPDNAVSGVYLREAVAVGAVSSVATLPLHLVLPHEVSVAMAAVVLAVIGAIYIGFALMEPSLRVVVVEGSVGTTFIGFALLGLLWWSFAIPIAYALHGAWDLLHHRNRNFRELARPPRWYPPFCVTFDWIFALGISLVWLL